MEIKKSVVVSVGDIADALRKVPADTKDEQLQRMRGMLDWQKSTNVNLTPTTIKKLMEHGYVPPEAVAAKPKPKPPTPQA